MWIAHIKTKIKIQNTKHQCLKTNFKIYARALAYAAINFDA